MRPYIGYIPVLGCCKPEIGHTGFYLCKTHGYKHTDYKPEGEQLKLELNLAN